MPTPHELSPIDSPNVELVRRDGWTVLVVNGRYVTAVRGREEVVLEWRGGEWCRVHGRGDWRAAA